ncbi:oligosaccharide flippase family protein, partial [Noviherbaspirillum sp. ST9]
MNNKEKAIKGGKWVSISTGVTTILQFLQISIVARLLEPASFGVVSISSMIIVFFTMFSNLGFNNSIISKQEEDRKVLSSLYFLNIFLGVIIFAIIYISSPVIASFYDAPNLSSIVKIASLFFLIVYFGQIYSILMQKEMRFKALSIIEIITTVIGTAATVLLAYNGY